jgi:hypothetical protein
LAHARAPHAHTRTHAHAHTTHTHTHHTHTHHTHTHTHTHHTPHTPHTHTHTHTHQRVETVADAARRRGRKSGEVRLSEAELDTLIWPRLFGSDGWDPARAAAESSASAAALIKGCPSHSLLAELAVTMALANVNGGGLGAVATLWDEVLEDIEFNYW